MNLRALHLVTPDDTVVTIPHRKMWVTNISSDLTVRGKAALAHRGTAPAIAPACYLKKM